MYIYVCMYVYQSSGLKGHYLFTQHTEEEHVNNHESYTKYVYTVY